MQASTPDGTAVPVTATAEPAAQAAAPATPTQKSVLAPSAPAPSEATGKAEPPPYKRKLQELQTQLKSLAEAKAAQVVEQEQARRSALSERDKLEEDRKALQAERDALRQARRKDAMSKLGILEKAAALVPDVDPIDPAGAQTLERWAAENPEFVRRAEPHGTAYTVPEGSKLAKILSGAEKSAMISREGLRKLLGG